MFHPLNINDILNFIKSYTKNLHPYDSLRTVLFVKVITFVILWSQGTSFKLVRSVKKLSSDDKSIGKLFRPLHLVQSLRKLNLTT